MPVKNAIYGTMETLFLYVFCMKQHVILIGVCVLLVAAFVYIQKDALSNDVPPQEVTTNEKYQELHEKEYIPAAGYTAHTYDCGDAATLGVFKQVTDNSTVSVEFMHNNDIALRETLPIQYTDNGAPYYEGFGAELTYTDSGIAFSYAHQSYECIPTQPTEEPPHVEMSL